jgi:hypothetical protein
VTLADSSAEYNKRAHMSPLDFDFLKDRYDCELQRKEQLTAALALPVGVLGGLGSFLAVPAGTATMEGMDTTLSADVDLTALPSGTYQLAIRRAGEDWQLFPVQLN